MLLYKRNAVGVCWSAVGLKSHLAVKKWNITFVVFAWLTTYYCAIKTQIWPIARFEGLLQAAYYIPIPKSCAVR